MAYLIYRATGISPNEEISIAAPIFQQFNPFYVVALTPVSMAIFGALASKGKEPSAPRKIAYGMLVAAIGFAIMAFGSDNLNTPNEQQRAIAVNKAESFAKTCYTYAPSIAKQLKKDSTDEYEYILVNKENAKIEDNAIQEMISSEDSTIKALGNNIKNARDFMGKLNQNTNPIFADVYNSQVVIIENSNITNSETNVTDANSAIIEKAKNTIDTIKAETKTETRTSPYWLILTYLILTFAELLLSPMGISFVSKVAPPKLKGMMMGGWFVATAIGNMLVSIGGFLWAGIPLTYVWTVFIVLCLLSAIFMFAMMKRLEKVAK